MRPSDIFMASDRQWVFHSTPSTSLHNRFVLQPPQCLTAPSLMLPYTLSPYTLPFPAYKSRDRKQGYTSRLGGSETPGENIKSSESRCSPCPAASIYPPNCVKKTTSSKRPLCCHSHLCVYANNRQTAAARQPHQHGLRAATVTTVTSAIACCHNHPGAYATASAIGLRSIPLSAS